MQDLRLRPRRGLLHRRVGSALRRRGDRRLSDRMHVRHGWRLLRGHTTASVAPSRPARTASALSTRPAARTCWDARCADEAATDCSERCTACAADNCCEARDGSGCNDDPCQACVCNVDQFCCDSALGLGLRRASRKATVPTNAAALRRPARATATATGRCHQRDHHRGEHRPRQRAGDELRGGRCERRRLHRDQRADSGGQFRPERVSRPDGRGYCETVAAPAVPLLCILKIRSVTRPASFSFEASSRF